MVLLVGTPKPDYAATLNGVLSLSRSLRIKRGSLSLTTQAKTIGISSTTLKAIDAGREPSYSTLLLCLRYLAR